MKGLCDVTLVLRKNGYCGAMVLQFSEMSLETTHGLMRKKMLLTVYSSKKCAGV